MVIQHNMAAMNAQRQFHTVTNQKTKRMERLSSGYRINRSADDAAGLAISEKMRWQIRGLDKAAQNISHGISFVQTGEGALQEVHSILQRMKELATQASNDSNTQTDREALDLEISQLKQATKDIFRDTQFNTKYIFRTPYGPDIDGQTNDYTFFNVGDGKTQGGIEINNNRYTWDELGVQQSNGVLTSDFELTFYDKSVDGQNNEEITLYGKAGDAVTSIQRRYRVSTDDTGIKVNGIYAATWQDSNSTIVPNKIRENGNQLSFDFHGMTIDFTMEDDETDTKRDFIAHLNTDNISPIEWFAKGVSTADYSAVHSTADSMMINVTNANAKDVENWYYKIKADADGVQLVQGSTGANPLSDAVDGVTHKKYYWGQDRTDFTNQDSGENAYAITDWGTSNDATKTVSSGGSSTETETLDSDATYRYNDTAAGQGVYKDWNGIDFNFNITVDEAGRDQVANGLTQTLSGGQVVAKMKSVDTVGTNTVSIGGASNVDFHYQRDALLRDFDSNNGTDAMQTTVERTKVVTGKVNDYEERKTLHEAQARNITDTYTKTVTSTRTYQEHYDADGNLLTTDNDTTTVDATSDWSKVNSSSTYSKLNATTDYSATSTNENTTASSRNVTPEDGPQIEEIWETVTNDEGEEEQVLRGYTYTYTEHITETYQKTENYYDTKNGSTPNVYMQNNSGNYQNLGSASNVTFYSYGGTEESGSNYDTSGQLYKESTYASGDSLYVSTANENKYIVTKTYDLARYDYKVKNSAGDVIMTGGSGTFLDTTDGIKDGPAEGGGALPAENVQNTIQLTQSNGKTRSYLTNLSVKSITMVANDGSNNYIQLTYDDRNDTNGTKNKTVEVDFTPDGTAKRSFYKSAQTGGHSTDHIMGYDVSPIKKELNIQAGAQGLQGITLQWTGLTNTVIGLSSVSVKNYGSAQASMMLVDNAIDIISTERSNFGAQQNRLEHAYAIDTNTSENTQAAESRIRDANMADESMANSLLSVLQQAGQSMIAQANETPQGVLQLLQ